MREKAFRSFIKQSASGFALCVGEGFAAASKLDEKTYNERIGTHAVAEFRAQVAEQARREAPAAALN